MATEKEQTRTMQVERAGKLRADLALFGITVIWGFTFPAMKLGLNDLSPLVLGTGRFALAALIMLAIFRGRVWRMNRLEIKASLWAGTSLAAGMLLQVYGLRYTTASKCAFITALYVVLVPILTLAIERVRPRANSMVAVVLATAGLYLITNPAGGFNSGDLLTIAAAFAFSVYIMQVDYYASKCDPVAFSFGQIVVTAVISALLLGITRDTKFVPSPWAIMTLITTGIFATALAFTIQNWAQRETSATHAAIIFAAEPVWATVFAWVIQHEKLSLVAGVGGGLILAGIVALQINAKDSRSVEASKR
jgi:drug/metabolite transporter (DMT)-like permease